MKVTLNDEQIKWLKQIVEFRVEDEKKEKEDLIACKRNEWVENCQQRIDMWQSILDSLSEASQ